MLTIIVYLFFHAVVIFVGVYIGNLTAFLATSKYEPPFNTLREMVDQTEYQYGTERGIFIEKIFTVGL